MRNKVGLEYFPVDVDWLSDDKLTIVQADWGNRGIGIVIRLLGEIYRNGYHAPWTERDQKRFALRAGEPVADVVAVVDVLISEGFFDQRLARGENPVLTSVGIQKRWKLAASRRAQSVVDNAINLLTDEPGEPVKMLTSKVVERAKMSAVKPAQVDVMSTICKQHVDNMYTSTTQSKGKESKGKETNPPKSPLPGDGFSGLIFPPSLDTEEHRTAWKNFLDHRRRIRKPYRSIEAQNLQLQRWSNRPEAFIAAITNAIANEWQGLHEPSGQKNISTTGISAREQRALDVIKLFQDEEALG